MVHEYAHSFTAWLLHWKANPLALDYGKVTLNNILTQEDIDENVDYGPIFASGHGAAASLIAVAGVLIGNGLCYLAGLSLYLRMRKLRRPGWAMFFFWLVVMGVGNFLSYVPIRTFTTHADMATTAQGLHASPWLIALVLGVPFAIAIGHFLMKILPNAEVYLFPVWPRIQGGLALLTTYIVFVFFGGSGIRNYGSTSHWLSVVSAFILFPLISIVCLTTQRTELLTNIRI